MFNICTENPVILSKMSFFMLGKWLKKNALAYHTAEQISGKDLRIMSWVSYPMFYQIDYQYLLLSKHSLPTLQIEALTSLLVRHSVYPNEASLLGLFITFVNNFHFSLVLIIVYLVNQSSVINLV